MELIEESGLYPPGKHLFQSSVVTDAEHSASFLVTSAIVFYLLLSIFALLCKLSSHFVPTLSCCVVRVHLVLKRA